MVAAAALAAGGGGETALRLGVSMVLLQASVGSLNDLIDAPHDAGYKPGKPIPAGLVRPVAARVLAVVAGAFGVALALPSGAATVALAVTLLALGYAYDLWFKGTAWSWVPFALAIPLFPTYGWLGAAGSLPAIWAVLLPAAMVAGAGLALGNAAVDVERDRAVGVSSVATAVGWRRAAAGAVLLTTAVAGVAVTSLLILGAAGPLLLLVVVGGAVAVAGAFRIRRTIATDRETGWKVQAAGIAVLGAGWIAAVAAAGLTRPTA